MLSDTRILEEMKMGNIIITPFNELQLGTNSYDVRLGNWFYVPQDGVKLVDWTKPDDVKRYWGEPVYYSSIVLLPGQTVLAHTVEQVGGCNGFTTEMRARSSIGRAAISVCKCAGVGDVGYIGKWTMEITNHGQASSVLHCGMRVAQILFFEVGTTRKEYTGKYGNQAVKWSPEDMLPKLSLDKF